VNLQETLRQSSELLREDLPAPCPCTLELPEEPLDVTGKADQLVQVFLNLMQNAVSFTQPGGQVRVRAWREGARALVSVSDEGPGIAEALLPRLFQPFQTGRKGGTGLGLAIVRKIVHAHHGDVRAANNDPPPGATFVVDLPLAR
jgi:signal transduction histidine kinase